jgi:phosphoribosylaminoimidazolecarboxamide formyltransferase/IMP cyclohydrolase
MTTIPLRRALISVSDKRGLEELAHGLHGAGVEMIASGGTAAAIRRAGVPVTEVAEVTGQGEMLGGRVKTLHPRIHAAILADPSDPDHRNDLDGAGIEPFQLVVANLYPFDRIAHREDAEPGEVIEQIDIGGPAMIRAAAKNHGAVAVVTRPEQYSEILEALAEGGTTAELRRRLAAEAFFLTATYDAGIVEWLERGEGLPERLVVPLQQRDTLRYGENPHQAAARYADPRVASLWDSVVQHGGVPLSYLNVFDTSAAWEQAHDLAAVTGRPTSVVIKHGNPCGAASGDSAADACRLAAECDPVSAFGGIVAVNVPIDEAAAEQLAAGPQADVVIAPGFGPGAVERLRGRRQNTRLLEAPAPSGGPWHLRQVAGGWLLQDRYHFAADPASWRVVTRRAPSDDELRDAVFAFRVCGWVASNAIVMARDQIAWGIGAGQPSRVDSAGIASRKAAGRVAGGACASDAFFPFPDGVEVAARAGVTVVVQPGGSVGDERVIAAADELGLAMLFTGERQFRH